MRNVHLLVNACIEMPLEVVWAFVDNKYLIILINKNDNELN